MSKDTHKQTLNVKNKKELDKFIKSGGRKGALGDFNKVLGKAARGKK